MVGRMLRGTRTLFVLVRKAKLDLHAAHLAFFTALLIVPLVAGTMSLLGLFGSTGPQTNQWRDLALHYLSAGAGPHLYNELETAVRHARGQVIGLVGFTFVGLSALTIVMRTDLAIQAIWGLEERRSLAWRLFFYAIVVAFLIPVSLYLIVSVLKLLPPHWTIVVAFCENFAIFLILFFLYKLIPKCAVPFAAAAKAAMTVTIAFMFSRDIYVWLTHNMFRYNKIYGSLAFLPLFLVWIYVLWLLVLFGVVLSRLIKSGFEVEPNKSEEG